MATECVVCVIPFLFHLINISVLKCHWRNKRVLERQHRRPKLSVSMADKNMACSHVGRPRGIKKFAVDKTTVCHPCKAQFVINIRSRGHFDMEACLWKAVFLQYYPLRSLAGLLLR